MDEEYIKISREDWGKLIEVIETLNERLSIQMKAIQAVGQMVTLVKKEVERSHI